MTAPRAILVGEDNPLSSNPEHALYPHPRNCAGERLQRLVLGVGIHEYLAGFERVNLCKYGKWSTKAARESALSIYDRAKLEKVPLVLLGAKVAKAFALEFVPFKSVLVGADLVLVVMLPHPSGRCRVWNARGAYEKAQSVLRAARVLRG